MSVDAKLQLEDLDGGVKLVGFTDPNIVMDPGAVSDIDTHLVNLVTSMATPNLVIDFDKVDHVTSALIGVLIHLHKAAMERDGSLKLANITPAAYEVFKICWLDSMFPAYESIQQAADAFNQE